MKRHFRRLAAALGVVAPVMVAGAGPQPPPCTTAARGEPEKANETVSVAEPKQTAWKPDRTKLPIKAPPRPTYAELDVRNVPRPERFDVKAPDGAPNVLIVLIDDVGFGAPSTFGVLDAARAARRLERPRLQAGLDTAQRSRGPCRRRTGRTKA